MYEEYVSFLERFLFFLSPSAAGAAFFAVLEVTYDKHLSVIIIDEHAYFLAALTPSVDFAGAFPAVEAGALEATAEAGFGGIIQRDEGGLLDQSLGSCGCGGDQDTTRLNIRDLPLL